MSGRILIAAAVVASALSSQTSEAASALDRQIVASPPTVRTEIARGAIAALDCNDAGPSPQEQFDCVLGKIKRQREKRGTDWEPFTAGAFYGGFLIMDAGAAATNDVFHRSGNSVMRSLLSQYVFMRASMANGLGKTEKLLHLNDKDVVLAGGDKGPAAEKICDKLNVYRTEK